MSHNLQNPNNGVAGAILFGLTIAVITSFGSLCGNPFFPVVIAASFVKGSTLWGFLMLFFFALGHSIMHALPMLGIGLGIGKISKILSKFAVFVKYIGAITLLGFGFYYLISF